MSLYVLTVEMVTITNIYVLLLRTSESRVISLPFNIQYAQERKGTITQ